MAEFQRVDSTTLIDIFWQNEPDSISAVQAPSWDDLGRQLLNLVGNNGKEWTLLISIGVPALRPSKGFFNPDQLLAFLQYIKKNYGVVPTSLGYHPDLQGSKHYSVWDGWELTKPGEQTLEHLAEKTVDDFVAFNQALSTDSSLPQFSSFHIEGSTVPDDADHFAPWRQALDKHYSSPGARIDLYSTGDWHHGLFSGIDGVSMQIYDFWNSNPFYEKRTDPRDKKLGEEIFNSLQVGGTDSVMNSDAFNQASTFPQVFSWNDSQVKDAPIFHPNGTVVGQKWSNADFQTYLQSYKQAFESSHRNPSKNSPVFGVWGAEFAIPQLANSLSNTRPLAAYSSQARANEIDVMVDRYQQDIILVAGSSAALDASVLVNCAYLNGIGLYPLLDASGRIVSGSGKIYSPGDDEYLAVAKSLSQSKSLWFEGGGESSASHLYKPVLQAQTRYAVIADSQINVAGGLSSSLRSANPGHQIHIAPDVNREGLRVGFEDVITGDQDFNDLVIQLNPGSAITFESTSVFAEPMLGDASVPSPDIDVLWQGITALDRGTAYQVAELIAGNSKNNDLELVINIDGPNNTSLVPSPKSHQDKGFTGISQTPSQLATFLNHVDFYVDKLGGEWTGSISYHPLATKAEEHNWLGHSGTTESGHAYTLDKTDPYKAYIDYLGVLNEYLAAHQTQKRQFSKMLLETENSRYSSEVIFRPDSAWRTYQGEPGIFGHSGTPALTKMDVDFVATGGLTSKWSTDPHDKSYWHADQIYAQFYDLPTSGAGSGDIDNDFPYTAWNDGSFADGLAPDGTTGVTDTYTPKQAADLFTSFSVNKNAPKNGAGGYSPRKQTYNLHKMITPDPSDVIAGTSFNPDAHLIFSYGPHPSTVDQHGKHHHTPVFQSGVYTTPKSDSIQWKWNHDEFSSFIANLRTDLPQALKGIADEVGASSTFVSDAEKLSLGVWAAELALDAWFDVPTPSQLPVLPELTILG